MSKIDVPRNSYWRNMMTRIAIIAISVILIVWCLPRDNGPQLRYDISKPWMYSSLIAKFDFPIYKTDEAIKAEQDSILSAFEPYYNYDNDVETEQVIRFREKFKEGIPGLAGNYVNLIADRLRFIPLYQ